MELKRDSRIVKWAYWDWFKMPPRRITLCVLFWRAVLITPFQIWIVIMSSPGWVPAWLFAKYCGPTLEAWVIRRSKEKAERRWAEYDAEHMRRLNPTIEKPPSTLSVLWQGVKAVKSKVCPLVEIVK